MPEPAFRWDVKEISSNTDISHFNNSLIFRGIYWKINFLFTFAPLKADVS